MPTFPTSGRSNSYNKNVFYVIHDAESKIFSDKLEGNIWKDEKSNYKTGYTKLGILKIDFAFTETAGIQKSRFYKRIK